MFTQQQLNDIKTHLGKLGRSEVEPRDPECGICREMERFGVYEDNLTSAFQRWPKYSGDMGFPIRGTGNLSLFSAKEAYLFAQDYGYMWTPSHPYGALRRELCLWLSENLTLEDLKGEGE